MRLAPIAALLLGVAPPASAQDVGPTDGTGVERVTMVPGDTAAFMLAQGYSHQLLRPTDPVHPAPHAIAVTYRVEGGESVVTVTSRTGYPTRCSVLADPDGDGGSARWARSTCPATARPRHGAGGARWARSTSAISKAARRAALPGRAPPPERRSSTAVRARNPLYIQAKPPPDQQTRIVALPRNDPKRGPELLHVTLLSLFDLHYAPPEWLPAVIAALDSFDAPAFPLAFDRIENRKAVTLRTRDPLIEARAFQAALVRHLLTHRAPMMLGTTPDRTSRSTMPATGCAPRRCRRSAGRSTRSCWSRASSARRRTTSTAAGRCAAADASPGMLAASFANREFIRHSTPPLLGPAHEIARASPPRRARRRGTIALGRPPAVPAPPPGARHDDRRIHADRPDWARY